MASEEWPFTNAWSLHGNRDIVSRYEILERIGEGTFGEVHRARRREDNVIVALKEIHNFESSSREIRALLLLDHPNVVKLHEYFAQGSNMVLVLEYLPYNLSEVIRAGKGEISDAEVKGWMVQILRGLAACHAASVLHRDLKPNNLLISENRTLKIADFGQARVLSEGDFVSRGELCRSDIHENYVTGTEARSVDGSLNVGYRRKPEFQVNASVAEGMVGDDDASIHQAAGWSFKNGKVEASGDYFGARKAHLSKATGGKIPAVAEFATSALTDSDNVDGNVMHFGSGPTNVGFSALADAVKDARNYFTIEEMVRSGTGMDGLGLSGLQKQRIIGSHTDDPGCCGWFPMESVENQHSGLSGMQNEIVGKDDAAVSVERDHHVREREDDLSSGDESDFDWKGKDGLRSEDLIDTLKRTEETHKTGLSSGPANKGGDGDFLQKLRRFIRKRTRRLNSEGKITSGPMYFRSERASAGGVGNSVKEAVQRDGHPTPRMHRSFPGSRKHASSERNSGNVKSTPSASENIVSSLGQQIHPQAQRRKGVRSFHGKERKSLESEPANDGEGGLERMDDAPAVSGRKHAQNLNQSPVKEGGGLTVPEKCEDQVMDDEEQEGDLRTESGRKLYGGLQVESKTRNKGVVSGPLREMAYARADEAAETATLGQQEFPQVDGRELMDLEKSKGDQTFAMRDRELMDLEKSKGDQTFAMRDRESDSAEACNGFPRSDQRAAKAPALPGEEVLGADEGAIPSTWGTGWKEVNGPAETGNGRWEGSSGGEPINGRDGCKSWTQTEGYNSALSDAEVEGTRWYGAPEFQYSYMDSKRAGPAGGKTNNEIYGRAIGSEEEWDEEGSEGGITYHRGGGDYSPEEGNSESEHGSDFTTMVGTRWYKAPELLYGATKYGTGIDIWAAGCIFGELLWGKPLFPGLNDIDQLSRVVRILGSPNEKVWTDVSLLPDFNKICFVDERSPLTLKNYLPHISEAALDFLQKLLTYDPVLRLSAEKAAEDEFFFKQPLPCPCHELPLPAKEESEASDEDWGDWKDPGSPFSDFEILG